MSVGLKISVATALHKGDREYQQDQLGVWSHPVRKQCLLGVIADGMGGKTGGRKASDQVVMTAHQLFERFAPDADSAKLLLQQIAADSHTVIRLTAASSDQEPHSTVAAFLIGLDHTCHLMHVGDSRVYHFQNGRLVHRTVDHSYVQSLVDKGLLTPEQAHNHPQSNVLMGCLGSDADPPVELHTTPVMRSGDSLLACSDGVWHYFSEVELAQIMHQLEPRAACQYLIQTARSRAGGHGDNLSVIAVRFDSKL